MSHVLYILIWAASLAVSALVVMWMWNLVVPDLFGMKPLAFWQAACLLVLCQTLFCKSDVGEKWLK